MGYTVATTARLFRNGRSQAVRLPCKLRFEGDRVRVRRVGRGMLVGSSSPSQMTVVRPVVWRCASDPGASTGLEFTRQDDLRRESKMVLRQNLRRPVGLEVSIVQLFVESGGVDGTRTRDLRRDRPAF